MRQLLPALALLLLTACGAEAAAETAPPSGAALPSEPAALSVAEPASIESAPDLFRDNAGFDVQYSFQGDTDEIAGFWDYSGQLEALIAEDVLPEDVGFSYDAFRLWGYGDSWEICWNTQGGADSLSVIAAGAGAEGAFLSMTAPTVTEYRGRTVQSTGTADTAKLLYTELEGGVGLQLQASEALPAGTLTALLDWFLERGLDLSRLAPERGDWTTVEMVEAVPEAFAAYVPPLRGKAPSETGDGTLYLRNGAPDRLFWRYSPQGRGFFTWRVCRNPEALLLKAGLGDLDDLTEEQVLEAAGNRAGFGFWADETAYLYVDTGASANMGPYIWELIERLRSPE